MKKDYLYQQIPHLPRPRYKPAREVSYLECFALLIVMIILSGFLFTAVLFIITSLV